MATCAEVVGTGLRTHPSAACSTSRSAHVCTVADSMPSAPYPVVACVSAGWSVAGTRARGCSGRARGWGREEEDQREAEGVGGGGEEGIEGREGGVCAGAAGGEEGRA